MKPFFTKADCDIEGRPTTFIEAISLEKANALLAERGRVVYGACHNEQKYGWQFSEKNPNQSQYDTHRALLINIEPIEQDKASDLLAIACAVFDIVPRGKQADQFKEQAKKLLGKEWNPK